MREQDLKQLVYATMSHPLFIEQFYKPNGERLLPVVEIPNSYDVNAYAGIVERMAIDSRTGRETKITEFKIGVTPLLIRLLDTNELKAVLGHELCHLKYKDYNRLEESKKLQSIILYIVIGASALFVPWYFLILGFILGTVLIKRNYYSFIQELEKRADLYGGAVSSPEAMVSALKKLQGIHDQINKQGGGKANTFTEHFQEHPSTRKRIEHLKDEEEKALQAK
jgi:Zn-dependent protease with chaperone function